MLYSKYIVSNDLSLIFFYTSRRIYSIPEESKYAAAFLSLNNEIHCVPLLFLSLICIAYAPYFFLGKSPLVKTSLNLGS